MEGRDLRLTRAWYQRDIRAIAAEVDAGADLNAYIRVYHLSEARGAFSMARLATFAASHGSAMTAGPNGLPFFKQLVAVSRLTRYSLSDTLYTMSRSYGLHHWTDPYFLLEEAAMFLISCGASIWTSFATVNVPDESMARMRAYIAQRNARRAEQRLLYGIARCTPLGSRHLVMLIANLIPPRTAATV